MKFSASQVRQLRRENAKWPETLTAIPREQWPQTILADSYMRFAVYRSRQFLVQAFSDGEAGRLTISRTDWDERKQRWRDDISWDDIQRLKGEAGFADYWAVEIYPDDAEIVNVANMRHIWILNQAPAFGWRCRTEAA